MQLLIIATPKIQIRIFDQQITIRIHVHSDREIRVRGFAVCLLRIWRKWCVVKQYSSVSATIYCGRFVKV